MNNQQQTTSQNRYIDLQSKDPEAAVTFKKYADIPTRFTSILKRFSCTHAIFPNNESELICLKRTNTIKDLLEAFFSHNVKAIPIIDDTQHAQNVVSQASLLHILVPFLMEQKKKPNSTNIEEFLKRRIDEFTDVLEGPLLLPQDSFAFDAFEMMKKYPNQRVLIVNNLEEKKLINLVSETRLTEVLTNILDDMEETLKSTPVEKIIAYKRRSSCELIHNHVSALEAFGLLASKNLDSVGVVDPRGKLLSVLTPTDIRAVGSDLRGLNLLLLQEPVESFSQHIRNPHEMDQIKPDVIACYLQDTVQSLLMKLAYWKVHRIFVVDKEGRAVTDITLLDVMSYFEHQEHKVAEEHHVQAK